jgi:antitoxin component YwqK of YwqJK toxin-antitoxin module
MKKDWTEFLLEYGGPKDIKFDIFFCKTSFYNDGVFVFKACEMQIQYSYKEDGEWYSGDETIYPELIIGDDQDNNFEPYIIINTPEHNEPELGDGWSNLGEMNFEETVKTLEEMNTLDYNLISEDEKEDFTYFSSSKIKSDPSQNGDIKNYYDNGQLKDEGHLESGQKNGLWKTYFDNGNIETERSYINGKENGKAKGWYETGELAFEADKKDNLPKGLVRNYHKNGNLKMECFFVGGKEQGEQKKYFEEGQLSIEGAFKKGQQEGTWKYYYKNGKLLKQVVYKNGEVQLVNKWDEQGDLESNDMESLQLNEEQKIVFSCYPNLRGIDFSGVKFGPSGNPNTPQGFFSSDIDGDWYYATSQMTMLFKAFSKDNFENNIHELLDKNAINFGDKIEKGTMISEHWIGDGFQIEHPVLDGVDLIFIINENIVPVGSEKFRTTELAPKVKLPDGYQNIGIEDVYDGPKFLKANNGKISVNIPLLFIETDPESQNYILIGISTLTLAKKIIDDIIEKNYGKTYFNKLEDQEGWSYVYANKYFIIGFMTEHLCIRINMLHKLRDIRNL